MDRQYFNRTVSSVSGRMLIGFGLTLALVACNSTDAPEGADSHPVKDGVTLEAATPTRANGQQALSKSAGAAGYIHFGDRNSCIYTPTICSQYSWVFSPGYIQPVSTDWSYTWMSNGPWTNPLPSKPASMSNPHYHITGIQFPEREPNAKATAMWGNWWMYVYMQRSGVGRINFDLTQINVLGTVPVRVWFKDAAGRGWQWSSLAPGRWNLPGATNIREVHISSASGKATDQYMVDDILVRGR